MEKILLARLQRTVAEPKVADMEAEVRAQLNRAQLRGLFKHGAKVGLTAGSRAIRGMAIVLRTVASEVKAAGGHPVVLAAMGSHGGGTPEGRQDVLAGLGITPESVGAPVIVHGEGVLVGHLPDGTKVYASSSALDMDALLVVNRIKSHTSFHGSIESGLLKMVAVGLGGPEGAVEVHSHGPQAMAERVPAMARVLLKKLPVVLGLAIVENSLDETAMVRALSPQEWEREEPLLLEDARRYMPRLPLSPVDVLVVGEMGKCYSGTGMDTNVIGRMRLEGVPEPEPLARLVVTLRLAEASHGNANGVGLADLITRRLLREIDFHDTYLNVLTTGFLRRGMVPLVMDHDRQAIKTAMELIGSGVQDIRLMFVRNTLQLEEVWVSEALWGEAGAFSGYVLDSPMEMAFDEAGNLVLPRLF